MSKKLKRIIAFVQVLIISAVFCGVSASGTETASSGGNSDVPEVELISVTAAAVEEVPETAEEAEEDVDDLDAYFKELFGDDSDSDSDYVLRPFPEDYDLIAQTDKLELYVNRHIGAPVLKDKKTGYIWNSVISKEEFSGYSNLNSEWKAYLQSVMVLSFNNMDKRDSPQTKIYSGDKCDEVTIAEIKDGFSATYKFSSIGFTVRVDYTLENNELVVRIPYDGISEESVMVENPKSMQMEPVKYGVYKIELLPFLGYAGDEVDGYMLYPDGSGGLTLYSNAENRPSAVKVGLWSSYSSNNISLGTMYNSDISDRYSAAMPVYGMKNGDNALFAVAAKGLEECGITAYPSGYVIKLNHMNFDISLRHSYQVKLSDVSIDPNTTQGKSTMRVDKEIIPTDKEFRYFILNGEQANYSAMADVYRNYLLSTNQIEAKIQQGGNMPLALMLFMSIAEESMFFDKIIKMTTYSQAIDILKDLSTKGVKNAEVILRGWNKKGYGYSRPYWPAESAIGGTSGLKKLNDYLSGSNFNAYLENDYFFADKDVGGFSPTKDVVVNGSNIPISNYNNGMFLFNPAFSKNLNTRFLKTIKNVKNLGGAYLDLGRIAYYDYNENNPYTLGQTVAEWQNMLKETKNENRGTAVYGFNQYVYKDSDFLYNVPTNAFGLFITDVEVPFVEMVISGLIPYCSTKGNLSYDLELEKLKWVEYGCVPYFELTHEPAQKLINTWYGQLFTSTYTDWSEKAISIYEEFNNRLKSVYGVQMKTHDTLESGVKKLGYANGVTVYVNYSPGSVKADGFTIGGKSYIVVENGVVK